VVSDASEVVRFPTRQIDTIELSGLNQLDNLAHRPLFCLVVHFWFLSVSLIGTASLGKCAKDCERYHAARCGFGAISPVSRACLTQRIADE
jgi:hypothetical protein